MIVKGMQGPGHPGETTYLSQKSAGMGKQELKNSTQPVQNLGGALDYPLSTAGNEMSADFGNNTLNDSLLKNHLRSSAIVPDSSKLAYN